MVVDVWVDLAEHVLRYFEVEVGSGTNARRVLLPANFASVKKQGGMIMVEAIKGEHFADVPGNAKANLGHAARGGPDRGLLWRRYPLCNALRQEPLI